MPQHIGVTESGTARTGMVKSAVGIGTLLMEGIGDTIRVSLSGDPVQEVAAGHGNSAGVPACGRIMWKLSPVPPAGAPASTWRASPKRCALATPPGASPPEAWR